MKNVFRTIADNNETGFQLVTLPTGTGKTHSMMEFIMDYLKDHQDDEHPRRIVLITSLKKNLVHEELKEAFIESGHPELYEENCLFLDSVSESVLNGWDDSMTDRILDLFPVSDEAKTFVNDIMLIRNLQNANVSADSMGDLHDRFSRDTEPAFRRLLRRTVRERCGKTVEDRYATVTGKGEWDWLPELYPAVHVTHRRVFSMSADKFVNVCDTIIGKSATVYDSDITNSSIVFIDEFDSTKSRIQDAIINRNLRRSIDVVDLFNRIRHGLDSIQSHPSRMYRPAPGMEFSEESIREHEEEVRDRFDEVAAEYRLDYVKKVRPGKTSTRGSFVFHGESILSVSSNMDFISMEFSSDENMDFIDLSGTEEGWRKFSGMFRDMRRAMRFFAGFVSKLSVNYSRNLDDPGMSFEDCIGSVLSIFGLRGDQKEYMKDEVLMSSDRQKSSRLDGSFYERGFRYYMFRDDRDDSMRSVIGMVSMDSTPEKVLLRVCRRALVFGMSATAELESVIGNYDLDYLRSELGDRFLPSVSDDPHLLSQIERSWSNYGSVDIDVGTCTTRRDGRYDKELWSDVIRDRRQAAKALGTISTLDDYSAERYMRAAIAIDDYLQRGCIAGICFFNKMPKTEDPAFDTGILRKLFDILKKQNGTEGKVSIEFVSGNEYEDRKKSLQKRLSEGERVLAVTTYGTLGAGQNIQYPVHGDGFVNISSRDDDDRADFDFVYIDRPTNIISNPHDNDRKETMGLIYEIQYLQESGEISRGKASVAVSKTLLGHEINKIRGEMIDTRSARQAAAGRVIQAIGRICRTNMKRPHIRILADENLKTVFSDPIESYGLTNIETRRLIECLHAPGVSDDDRFIQKANLRSHRAMSTINRLRTNWNTKTIGDWISLREFVLKHPTTDDPSDVTYNMYVETPERRDRYWYVTKDDFGSVSVSFSKPDTVCEEVSKENARLDELMMVDDIRRMFEARGYVTSFAKARYILSPPLFKNIYKGAIGEVVGDHIMRTLGFQPRPVPNDDFEMFDAMLGDEVYLDYKHWSSSDFTSESEQTEHIFGKLEAVNGRAAIIANVLRRKDDESVCITYRYSGMIILTVPWLFEIADGMISPNIEAVDAIRKVIG